MAVNILLKRSATASKRPVGASMAFGELNLNYDAATGGLFYKDSNGDVVKVGPCQVSATAPNSSPAGSAGNSEGEFWFDTATQTLKIYDGSAWVEAGGSVQGVTGSAPITVDNTDPLNPVVGIDAASTTSPGAVQLNDTTSSTSTTEALTANQGRVLQEQIDALVITSNLTLAGTYNASTGLLDNVTTAGAAVGFVNGSPLPAPAPGNQDYFVIVDVEGSTGPSGTPPYHIGDWFLSDGSAWLFLNVGFQAPYATTTTEGVVQLATDAEVQAGVNTDHVVTPSGLQSKLSDSVISSSSTTIASSLAVKDAYDAGFQGQTDAAAAQATANAAMPKAGGTFTGSVIFDAGTTLTLDTGSTFLVDGTTSVSGGTTFVNGSNTVFDTGSITEVNGSFTFNTAPTFPSGVDIGAAAQVTYDNATSGLSATNVQAAIDEIVDEFVPDASFTAAGDLLVGTGAGTYSALSAGAADYILQSNGDGTLSWVANSSGDVTSVSGTAPITVDNTDPQNPIVGIDAASTTAAGAVQLNNTVTSTSTSQAATANAVKIAYDTAVAAAASGNVNGITSDTVIFVNSTDGNDSTGQRGTTKPFLTITAALAAASEGDTIFLSPGTFTENVTFSKGVNMVGTMNDQALAAGTRISGNFVVNISGAPTRNWAISHVYFISTNSTPPFSVTNNSFGAGGIGTVNNCTFTQQLGTDPTQYAVVTSGTWSRSLYFRECTFDGNFHHNAGTAAGASGYVVIDRLLGVGNSGFYNRVTTGTVEFRNPSNSLAAVFQTGGVVLINGASAGITPSGAGLNSVFGSANFSYKGSAAAAGAGTVYFSGECQGTGKVEIGANLIYGYTGLILDPANLTINVAAIPYTTAVPAAANAQTLSQQRPRLDLLKSTSSVAAANQLATVVDSATGTVYTVAAMDAGTY